MYAIIFENKTNVGDTDDNDEGHLNLDYGRFIQFHSFCNIFNLFFCFNQNLLASPLFQCVNLTKSMST